ncbi:4'-phosphopantetheinyl transferase superfamily protein [Photorhabdus antumapuensis]|uniref:4'-phosphopantetheinyl transferase superfamily protein n=1 Tax=Photorhabdus antumapuensis TaxID=2862867 RepID=UPI001CED32D8|nr:4'-phosphopantetheinyl transferase superfamily protein [Photorhabdus antumapuensis]
MRGSELLIIEEITYFRDIFDRVVLQAHGPAHSLDLCSAHSEDILATKLYGLYRRRAGRACARLALEMFGISQPPIHRTFESPVFPDGFVGSVSHAEGISVACIAKAGYCDAVGIDVESIREEDFFSLAPHVFAGDELHLMRSLSMKDARLFFYSCFSAKEALYKAIGSPNGMSMNFFNYEVLAWSRAGSISIKFSPCRPYSSPAKLVIESRWCIQGHSVLTLTVIPSKRAHR